MSYGNHVDRYFILRCSKGLDLTACRNAKELAIEALRLHFREEGYTQSSVDTFNAALQEFVAGICDWDEE